MRKLAMATISLGILLLLSSVGFAFSSPCNSAGSILSVKNTSSGNYEYVTFRLKNPLNSNYSHSVTTVYPPFVHDPGGNPITINGSKFKKIRFQGVFWTCSPNEIFSLPKAAIKGIKLVTQWAGVVEYVVGYRNRASTYYVSTTNSSSASVMTVVMKFHK